MNEALTYGYCTICAYEPQNERSVMNVLRRYWSADDGWKIGALCHCCWDEVKDDRPDPDDYAYATCRDDCCSGEPETDLDPTLAI